jgi:phytoene desaturase
MDQLRTRFGIPDLDERIVCEREITPHEWGGMGIQFGATFNLAHNLGQMLHKRPHHKLQGFEGVWLVGGGTHPGSGLPVIFLSSQITASMLCDRLGLSYAGAGTQMDTRTGAARSRRLIERAAAARSADAGADAAAAQPAGV